MPIISGFEVRVPSLRHCSACMSATANSLFDVTSTVPDLVRADSRSGNWSAAQFANQGGDWLIAVNEAGDAPLRFVTAAMWEHVIPPDARPLDRTRATRSAADHRSARQSDRERARV